MNISAQKLFLTISILLLLSCFNSDKKEINNLLDKRQKAFELKDEGLYSSLIVENYINDSNGKKIDKDGVINQFKINVSAFDKISFVKSKREIFVKKNSAKAILDTSIALTIDNETVNYSTKELLSFVKVDDKVWEISKESELDLFRGFVFGEK